MKILYSAKKSKYMAGAIIQILQHTLRSVNDVTEGITQEPPMGDS